MTLENALYVLGATLMLAIAASSSTDDTAEKSYCHVKRCNQRNHTLCKYPLLRTSQSCGEVTSSNVTDDEVRGLLEMHNEKNQSKPLVWDKELADIAQTWADQCDPRLDECRNVDRFLVSQSYAYIRTTGAFQSKLTELVNLSQVTKRTTHMGCGAVRYNSDGRWNTTYLVCNYGNADAY